MTQTAASNVVTPQHILDLSNIASASVLRRWFCTRPYADEVHSQALVSATEAARRYDEVGVLFTAGLKYAVGRLVACLKHQRYLPGRREVGKIVPESFLVEEENHPIDLIATQPVDNDVEDMLKTWLSPRTADIAIRMWLEDEGGDSVGESYGITRQRVYQILNAARRRLRDKMRSEA